jgi:hypothetical protein
MINTHSCKKINGLKDLGDFDSIKYSKFKYGSNLYAREFAYELLNSFLESGIDLQKYRNKGIIVTASPYKYLEPAAFLIAKHFLNFLNYHLYTNSMDAAHLIKINRSVLFEGDYGILSKEERTKLMSKDKLTVDKDFVKDKLFIIIDDIKITGSHENKIINMINESKIECDSYYLYYAELLDKTANPKIEFQLNHSYVNSLKKIEELIDSNFVLNARICKYILETKEPYLNKFLNNQGYEFLINLRDSILGDGYNKMKLYQNNFIILNKMIDSKTKMLKLNKK